MTDESKNKSDKARLKEEREARLAQNLRDNLRRRKAAGRKGKDSSPSASNE